MRQRRSFLPVWVALICALIGAGLLANLGWSLGISVPIYMAPDRYPTDVRARQALIGAVLGFVLGVGLGLLLGLVIQFVWRAVRGPKDGPSD